VVAEIVAAAKSKQNFGGLHCMAAEIAAAAEITRGLFSAAT
jgi:hypothetical protein